MQMMLRWLSNYRKETLYWTKLLLTSQEATNWRDYHNMAMEIIGKQVELVQVPFSNLRLNIPNLDK